MGVVIATSTAPAACAGVMAVTVVALTTVTLLTATPPRVILVTAVKCVPVIVTEPPPAGKPIAGVILLMLGAGRYVNPLDKVAKPAAVVRTISTTPAPCAGVTNVTVVLFTTRTLS